MTERRKKKKVIKKYNTKEAAQREAARQRARGREANVYYDRSSGKWIVEVFVLLVALSLFGAILRGSN